MARAHAKGWAAVVLALLLLPGCSLAGMRRQPTTPSDGRPPKCGGKLLLVADGLGAAGFGLITASVVGDDDSSDAAVIATVGPTLLLITSLAHGLSARSACEDARQAWERDHAPRPEADGEDNASPNARSTSADDAPAPPPAPPVLPEEGLDQAPNAAPGPAAAEATEQTPERSADDPPEARSDGAPEPAQPHPDAPRDWTDQGIAP